MTLGTWECKKCGYVIEFHPIYLFVQECPECGIKYKYLADVIGYHVSHLMPLYIMEGEGYEKMVSNRFYVMAFRRGGLTFYCRDEGFYEYMKKKDLKNVTLLKYWRDDNSEQRVFNH